MSESWPDLAGRLGADGHVLPVRVYFEDTDFSGVVYHGAYVRFMERGRSDFLRLLGIGHDALARGEHGESLAFAVRRMKLEFNKPARIDDTIQVRTVVKTLSGARITVLQTVERDGVVLVSADVEVALISPDGLPRRLPSAVRARLEADQPG
jgi:acyl-CoA thioester hydrolase